VNTTHVRPTEWPQIAEEVAGWLDGTADTAGPNPTRPQIGLAQ